MFNFFSSNDEPAPVDTQPVGEITVQDPTTAPAAEQTQVVDEPAVSELTDIDSLAEKYAPKEQSADTSALLATVQALQAEIAQLKGQPQQPQQTPPAPDVFAPEQFEHALENPQMLRSGIESMITNILQGHMTELRDIVKETVTGTTQQKLQEYQATQQAHSTFYESRPHLTQYKDMVRMVANELQPRYGTGDQKQFMDLVGAVATERLKSFGVAFPNQQQSNQTKAPVLPTVQTTTPSTQTTNNGMTPGEAFIASIF